jgi:uncharacterized protein
LTKKCPGSLAAERLAVTPFRTAKRGGNQAVAGSNPARGVMKTALITGASSGIGRELARHHASRGGDLIVVARRRERLAELKEELEKKFGTRVHIMVEDLSRTGAAGRIHERVKSKKLKVDYLINNASFGGYGLFQVHSIEKYEDMINVNLVAMTELTRLFLDELVRSGGKIMNVSAVAGFLPGPGHAVYYATKAYVNSLTDSLATELEGTKVTVTALCPGLTRTEFHSVAGRRGASRGMPASRVAREGYEAMLRGGRSHIPGFSNKLLVVCSKLIPRRLLGKITKRIMKWWGTE